VLLWALAWSPAPVRADDPGTSERLLQSVRALAGRPNWERRDATFRMARALGLEPRLEAFGREYNVVCPAPAGKPRLIVCAHYDRAGDAPGANDNASGVAVVLEVAHRLRGVLLHLGLEAVFFGDEETGLLGSQGHVKREGKEDLVGVYNADMVGCGDALVFSATHVKTRGQREYRPLFTGERNVLTALKQAAEAEGWGYEVVREGPGPGDHASFALEGVPALMINVAPAGEVGEYRKVLTDGAYRWWRELSAQDRSRHSMGRIHTADDTLEWVDGATLARVADVLERAVKTCDSTLAETAGSGAAP
jgi:Zn-dependent M28 family amino/carboxypeptidase